MNNIDCRPGACLLFIRKWAKEQRIIENKDGSIILEIKTSGLNDVKRWVLSYGADAKVIEPEKLKKRDYKRAGSS